MISRSKILYFGKEVFTPIRNPLTREEVVPPFIRLCVERRTVLLEAGVQFNSYSDI